MAFCDDLECWQLTEGSSKFCKDHAHSTHKLDLSGLANVKLEHHARPSDEFSKAVLLTQNAINNLGAPIHASMTDHQPVDVALAQALTQTAIAHQGEKHADHDKLPADRALAEALTFSAIQHDPQNKLKETGRRSSLESGLSAEQQAALLEQAKAEKERAAAARVYGGGDAKEGMAKILGEIQNQGGIIAVPHDKVPDENITLNQIKTLAQINALQEGAQSAGLTHTEGPVDHSIIQARTLLAVTSESAKSNLTHAETPDDLPLAHANVLYAIDHMKEPQLKHDEHKVKDATLAHEKTLYAISHHREQSVPSDKAPVDKAIAEALTLNALGSDAAKSHLKHIDHPDDSLTLDDIAALQAAARQEKQAEPESPAAAAEPAATLHLPKTDE